MTGGSWSGPTSCVDSRRDTTGSWDFPTAVLSHEPIFDALSHPRRRFLLYSLRTQAELTLSEFAEALADWEDDYRGPSIVNDSHQVYVSLHHTHLPKLAKHDIVDVDDETGVVTPGPNAAYAFAALAGAGRGISEVDQTEAGEAHEERFGT